MPPDWLAFHDGAPVGSTVPIPLDLEEMGLPEGMTAQVVANEPCPQISSSPGRVVLTTVNHLNPQVVELTLRPVAPQHSLPSAARGRAGEGADAGHVLPLQPSGSSNQETVRPTAHHKFYSETRDQWLSAEDLQPGERLRGLTGPLQVVSQRPIPGTHRVYNMTVEGEHVYHVSTLGVLAHNMQCAEVSAPRKVYRVLRKDQSALQDIVAKAPDNLKRGPAFHVARGSKYDTRFISTTRSLKRAREIVEEFGGGQIVEIDLARASGVTNVIDVSTTPRARGILKHPRTLNMATKNREVLLEGRVTVDALRVVQ